MPVCDYDWDSKLLRQQLSDDNLYPEGPHSEHDSQSSLEGPSEDSNSDTPVQKDMLMRKSSWKTTLI